MYLYHEFIVTVVPRDRVKYFYSKMLATAKDAVQFIIQNCQSFTVIYTLNFSRQYVVEALIYYSILFLMSSKGTNKSYHLVVSDTELHLAEL